MKKITIKEIKTFFQKNLPEDPPLDWKKIDSSILYMKTIWKLREIGEYSKAVEYLAGKPEIMGINATDFTAFCDRLFYNKLSEEDKIAQDIVTATRELNDERHYIFSGLLSSTGEYLKDKLNETYACVRALRYEAIRKELVKVPFANVVDLGCAEARLEEHCNVLNSDPENYTYHVADRSSYILTQARYRNRAFPNLKYFCNELHISLLKDMFVFEKESLPLAVIVSEFLEHMTKTEAYDLLKNVLLIYAPDKLIITTPNYDYSELYKKDDPNNLVHLFEYREQDFSDTLQSILSVTHDRYELSELKGIAGDGIRPQSLFAVLTKKTL